MRPPPPPPGSAPDVLLIFKAHWVVRERELWCLMLLSTIIHLYRGGQCY